VGSPRGLVLIDPGPPLASHHEAIVRAVGERQVAAVFVTHTHPDHAPLANPIARHFEVPAYGWEPGPDFNPDLLVVDRQVIDLGEPWEVIHTPGHSADHICLRVGAALFSGDHVVGGSSVMVEEMSDYFESLRKIERLELERIYPGHGPEIDTPGPVISWYLAHRMQREQEILAAVATGARNVDEIVEVVYRDVDRALFPLARQSVTAHVGKLKREGRLDQGFPLESR
jgi:glyoxylase-like metal-dependent hydrolase (beta-lactamase superfamily II)